jgi:hypothetical protein
MISHVFPYSEGLSPTILIGSLFSSEKAAPDFTPKQNLLCAISRNCRVTNPSVARFSAAMEPEHAPLHALSRPVTRLPLPLKLIMIWHSEKFFNFSPHTVQFTVYKT